MLLADRLRTHMTRIVSDDTFQEAKKKDSKARRKNAGMLALRAPNRRPNRALQTLLASSITVSAYSYDDDDLPYELQNDSHF